MKIIPLAVVSLVLIAGCAGQGDQHQNPGQKEKRLVFSVPDASYVLTPECTSKAEIEHDEEGKTMLVVSMKKSPQCSEKAFEVVFSKVGQRLTVKYGSQVLAESGLIVTPVDPALPTWLGLGVNRDAQAQEIIDALERP